MSPTIGLPPPEPESCLITSRVSRFKGGTLIAEDVGDLATHSRRICDPDGYRPDSCPRCHGEVLHVHCYPERHPRGEMGMPPVIRIVQYVCAHDGCRATWRILPLFLARHLWRVWRTVERAVAPQQDMPTPAQHLPIPERTRSRWRDRLRASARVLVALLAVSGAGALEALAMQVGLDGTRAELVDASIPVIGAAGGARLASLAALVHRLERGLRLV
jgi:hypothetical protein